MIIKPHQVPSALLQYEALERRIPDGHRHKETIQRQAKNLRVGYQGERSLDFSLQFLPSHEFYIFHNLRLQDRNGFFQIDTLIACESFALIVEVKNIHGVIEFDPMGQAIRTKDDGTEERFNHPLDQVNLQQQRFRSWLTHHKFLQVPIEKVVVYTNPRTILKNNSQNKSISHSIIHKERLQAKIETFTAIHTNQAITKANIKQLSSLLLQKHTDNERNVMDVLNIQPHELMTGVVCPTCDALPMIRKRKKWYCTMCETYSTHAHMEALNDYQILFGTAIKNQQARLFLQIDSSHVTKRILKKAKYSFEGKTSDRMYRLSSLD